MLDIIRRGAQSLAVKVIFGVIIIVFVFWGMGSGGGSSSHTLATVGKTDITLREFAVAYNRALESERLRNPKFSLDEKTSARLKRAALSQLVLTQVRLQEADRLGLFVTPHELLMEISRNPAFQNEKGAFDQKKYISLMTSGGRTPGAYEEDVRRELLQDKLLAYVAMSAGISEAEARREYDFLLEQRKAEYVLFPAADYRSKVSLTEDEITAYYHDNKERYRKPAMADLEYLTLTPATLSAGYAPADKEIEDYYKAHQQEYSEQEKYQARHIFLRCPPEEGADEAAQKKIAAVKATMDDIAAQLAKGADFSTLAKKYSEDKPTADLGGLLPWLEKGQLGLPELDAAALALKKGEVSAPLRTPFGFQILKLEDKSPAGVRPLAEVKDEIAASLGKEKVLADFSKIQTRAEDALTAGTPFATLAGQLHTSVRDTGLVELQAALAALGLTSDARRSVEEAVLGVATVPAAGVKPQSANATAPAASANATARANATVPAAAASAGVTIPVPVNVSDGIALVRIKEAQASHIPPLEAVRADIVTALTDNHALVLAQEAARTAMPSFTASSVPAEFSSKLQTSEAFDRIIAVVPPLGDAPGLAEALFQVPKGQWLPSVFATATGAVIARVSEVIPAPEAEWEQQRDAIMQDMLRARQDQAVSAFMQDVFAKTELKEASNLQEQLDRVR